VPEDLEEFSLRSLDEFELGTGFGSAACLESVLGNCEDSVTFAQHTPQCYPGHHEVRNSN
jgi:hypothetical protein